MTGQVMPMTDLSLIRRWYSVREVVGITGLSRDTVMRLCRKGKLKYARPSPRCIRIEAESLNQLMTVQN